MVDAKEILEWDVKSLEAFLVKNNMKGCGAAIAKHNIDGRTFLELDRSTISKLGLSIVQQSKLMALLNELGPQLYNMTPKETALTAATLLGKHNVVNPDVPIANETGQMTTQQKPPLPPFKPAYLRQLIPIAATANISAAKDQDDPREMVCDNTSNQKSETTCVGETPIPANIGETSVKINCHVATIAGPPSSQESYDSFSSDDFLSEEEKYENPDECRTNRCELDGVIGGNVDRLDKQPHRGYLRFAGPAARNLLKRLGCATVECYVRSSQRVRRKLAPKYACPCDLLVMTPVVNGDPLINTPPVPPIRNRGPPQYSSQSSLDGRSNLSSTSASSQSSLVERLPRCKPLPPPPVSQSRRSPGNEVVPKKPDTTSSPIKAKSSPAASALCHLVTPREPATSRGANSSLSNFSSGDSADASATQPWYFDIERKEAEYYLTKSSRSGTFLIRPSKRGGRENPFTLSLLFNKRSFHIHIRLKENGKLALGTEKPDENSFPSLSALVLHHQKEPMHLHADGKLAGKTRLVQWPEKMSRKGH